MRTHYPRLIGLLGFVWSPILQAGALAWPSDLTWAAFTLAWIGASTCLVLAVATRQAAAAIASLSLLLFVGPGTHLGDGLALLFWAGLIVACTEGRPLERALLVRVMVTTAYAFAALSKLNPSFLSGEQLIGLTMDRSQLSGFEGLLRAGLAVPLSFMTVALEAWMALGMWFERTRVPTMAIGIVLHVGFIVGAHNGTLWDIAFVTVLNGALVASYLAFTAPYARPRVRRATSDR